MTDEWVVDANVLAHSSNPTNKYFASAVDFVAALGEEGTIALDDTGKTAPLIETSNMYREYTECLAPGSIAREIVRHLAETGRIAFYRSSKGQRDICKSLVPYNHHDQIVFGVGLSSIDHIIVSNDYADFTPAVRKQARKKLGVTIVDSDAA